MASLVYADTDGVERSFTVGPEPVVVGRANECAIRSTDPRVSRNHARFYLDHAGTLHVEDLGSSNGVYIGQQKVTHSAVPMNEIVLIGSLTFRLVASFGAAPTLEPDYGGSPYGAAGSPYAAPPQPYAQPTAAHAPAPPPQGQDWAQPGTQPQAQPWEHAPGAALGAAPWSQQPQPPAAPQWQQPPQQPAAPQWQPPPAAQQREPAAAAPAAPAWPQQPAPHQAPPPPAAAWQQPPAMPAPVAAPQWQPPPAPPEPAPPPPPAPAPAPTPAPAAPSGRSSTIPPNSGTNAALERERKARLSAEEERDAYGTRMAQLHGELRALKETLESTKAELAKARVPVGDDAVQQRIEQLETDRTWLTSELETARARAIEADEQLKSAEARQRSTEEELSVARADLMASEERLVSEISAHEQRSSAELASRVDELEVTRADLIKAEDRVLDLSRTVAELEQKLAQLTGKF